MFSSNWREETTTIDTVAATEKNSREAFSGVISVNAVSAKSAVRKVSKHTGAAYLLRASSKPQVIPKGQVAFTVGPRPDDHTVFSTTESARPGIVVDLAGAPGATDLDLLKMFTPLGITQTGIPTEKMDALDRAVTVYVKGALHVAAGMDIPTGAPIALVPPTAQEVRALSEKLDGKFVAGGYAVTEEAFYTRVEAALEDARRADAPGTHAIDPTLMFSFVDAINAVASPLTFLGREHFTRKFGAVFPDLLSMRTGLAHIADGNPNLAQRRNDREDTENIYLGNAEIAGTIQQDYVGVALPRAILGYCYGSRGGYRAALAGAAANGAASRIAAGADVLFAVPAHVPTLRMAAVHAPHHGTAVTTAYSHFAALRAVILYRILWAMIRKAGFGTTALQATDLFRIAVAHALFASTAAVEGYSSGGSQEALGAPRRATAADTAHFLAGNANDEEGTTNTAHAVNLFAGGADLRAIDFVVGDGSFTSLMRGTLMNYQDNIAANFQSSGLLALERAVTAFCAQGRPGDVKAALQTAETRAGVIQRSSHIVALVGFANSANLRRFALNADEQLCASVMWVFTAVASKIAGPSSSSAVAAGVSKLIERETTKHRLAMSHVRGRALRPASKGGSLFALLTR